MTPISLGFGAFLLLVGAALFAATEAGFDRWLHSRDRAKSYKGRGTF